ncbi:MAG TPA: twin-arginine translocase TatA/TatE family subunit [Myxococcales bacterium]|jgi:sec-independent protein translocase protein TatB|nr:twin-arginine translocase TatA/TatE family subunit [Myxococcales bacterium]
MFNIGPGELMVILILALVLLGPDKLPEVARSIGKGMKEIRRATEDIRNTVEEELYRAEAAKPKPPVSPLPALTASIAAAAEPKNPPPPDPAAPGKKPDEV